MTSTSQDSNFDVMIVSGNLAVVEVLRRRDRFAADWSDSGQFGGGVVGSEMATAFSALGRR
ncbi:hypothetical protein ITP53_20390 [Nonomuraea sp. K274]|uniref:Uncharacterized protein n=1 Tax=Nonomuraea cypriaca TaxID=1187855 RepID=A0A931A7Y2_9ACTN|nr:hypothetical protein [Nonomuraea cypriaca]MBF8188052.1 hypothetical protein [Nonomuraea cypriaca]